MRTVQKPSHEGKGEARPWEAPDAFDKLTPAARDALGRVYIGLLPGCSRRTLDALVAQGWITESEEEHRGTGSSVIDRIPIKVKVYGVPSIAAHMAWCAWCAEQPDDES
jgi:hypothetical protein